MAPNESGPRDPLLRRLDLIDSNGVVLVVLWNYTCHPTAFPARDVATADYVGVVREEVRDGRQIPVLFFQGFTGDVRPPSSGRWRDSFLRRLRLGPHFRDFTWQEFTRWSEQLATAASEARRVESFADHPVSHGRSSRIVVDSSEFVRGGSVPSTVFQAAGLGPVVLVGSSAEPVVELAHVRDGGPGGAGVEYWNVGYLDDVVGYVPTTEQVHEGGYEVDGFCESFGCTGVNPQAEATFRESLREVVRALDAVDAS